jgi:hypothetical protein
MRLLRRLVAWRNLRSISSAEAYVRASLGNSGSPLVVRGCDHGLLVNSTARNTLTQSVWDGMRLDVFEGNAKQQWIDDKRGWCWLCSEPVGGNLGVHISDRDHVCLGLFAYMIAQYPRDWSFERVLQSASRPLREHAAGIPWSQDHLHCTSDCVRRAEITGLLFQLCQHPHDVLSSSFSGKATSNVWVSGERMFKVHLSRLVTVMSPPMAPGVHTQFTHKCWGRSNLERVYDALNIADIKEKLFKVEAKTTRDARAYWMRLLFWEAMTALDNRDVSPVTEVLLEELLRRLAFELIFHMSMYYMNRATQVWQTLSKEPSVALLSQLNSL